MKDHKKAELVNQLVDIAVEYQKKPSAQLRSRISSLLISELGQAEYQYHQEVDEALYTCLGVSLCTVKWAHKERNSLDAKSLKKALSSLEERIAAHQGMIKDILGKLLKIGNIYVFKVYGDFGHESEQSGKLVEIDTSGKLTLNTQEFGDKYHTINYEQMKVFYGQE